LKHVSRILVLIMIFIQFFIHGALAIDSKSIPIELTIEEKQWLNENRDRVLVMGINPNSGLEHFVYKGQDKGYLIQLIEIIKKDLGLNIRLDATKTWGEVYSGLKTRSIDILVGANETSDRKKYMAFTRPINKITYAIVASENSSIHTIGDIDNKTVGFMQEDIIIDLLPSVYKNIKYKSKFYPSEEEGVLAVNNGEVDAFIMGGGAIVYDYIYRFPKLKYAFKINTITSDMTLSTRIEDKVLASILDKEIKHLEKDSLPQMISKSEIEYNIKIMNLTPEEIEWLKSDGKAVVGITKDYLPFDFYENEEYKGISGEIINEISRKTGIKFEGVYDDFDQLYNKLVRGEIDVLNIAKTEDRLQYVLYPRPYSDERDVIIGRKDSKDVRDIFGLEGKRVAVIKGFWHYEHLIKNLTDVEIVETNSIQESLLLVQRGKADYLIENPTVYRYYIQELQLYDLVEKGVTSNDSYLYYGIAKGKPELASIIDKVLPLIDIQEMFRIGYEEVPHASSGKYYKNLILAISGLGALLIVILLIVAKLIKDLIREKTESELLRQREHFLYTDAITNLYNRNYFNRKVQDTLDLRKFPQSIIIADMNNLKRVNDKFGHHMGDELLKLFAEVLKEACPKESIIIRMGGDEFCVILENVNEHQAKIFIESIKKTALNKNILADENQTVNAIAAIGCATRHTKEENFDEVIKTADREMYGDKSISKQMPARHLYNVDDLDKPQS
jgi:diguanylate cyclase